MVLAEFQWQYFESFSSYNKFPETRDIWMYKKSEGWTEMEGGLTKGQRYGQKGRHIDGQNDGQTDRWTNRNTEW